jgi:hypothetical protein
MTAWGPVLGYNSRISHFTAGQFGWFASDETGLLDVLKTMPVIEPSSVMHTIDGASAATYNGTAKDRPYLGEFDGWSPYGDVSINRVVAVEYRIASVTSPGTITGPWQDATPADGVFDSGTEAFTFITPSLRNGTYEIHIRAVNTVGAVTSTPYVEPLVVTGSSTTNLRPFASFTVGPDRAKVGTVIAASASASSDLDSGPLTYSWRWDAGPPTPFSPSPTATRAYTTPGTYNVELRVRDALGLIHQVSRTVTMESYDTAPVVMLSATPENRHFVTPSATHGYSVSLSVAGTRDAETPFNQLSVQWDGGCDGWDGPPTLQKTQTVTLFNQQCGLKSEWRCVRARVTDTAGNATEAQRFVWVVPHNRPPTISGVTFTPAGTDFTVTIAGSDPDPGDWDGLLEYRLDFEGDGVWDTRFTPTWTYVIPAANRFTLVVEARDRFHGRARWSAAPGCNPNCV